MNPRSLDRSHPSLLRSLVAACPQPRGRSALPLATKGTQETPRCLSMVLDIAPSGANHRAALRKHYWSYDSAKSTIRSDI